MNACNMLMNKVKTDKGRLKVITIEIVNQYQRQWDEEKGRQFKRYWRSQLISSRSEWLTSVFDRGQILKFVNSTQSVCLLN